MPELRSAYRLRTIMNKAWLLARAAARRFNAPARQFIAEALKQAWTQAKARAAEIAAQRQCVLDELAKIRAENSPFGLARQRRAEVALAVELQAHCREMAARMAAYRAKWGTGVSVPATRVAA